MSQFLYFVPTDRALLRPADLPPRLREIFRDGSFSNNRLHREGPGDKRGIVISAGDCRYDPMTQCWHRSQCGEYHVGWNPAAMPGPDDLIRPKPLDGDLVEMGDGKAWSIPILHGAGITIPRAMGYGPNGDVVLRSLPRYDELLSLSEKYLDKCAEERIYGTFDDWQRLVTGLLAVNYRVSTEECLALSLILVTGAFFDRVLYCCLGFKAIADQIEAQKKTLIPRDGSEASRDGEDFAPATP